MWSFLKTASGISFSRPGPSAYEFSYCQTALQRYRQQNHESDYKGR